MTFSPAQRLTLWLGTLLCAGLIALNLLDIRALTGWRLFAVVGGALFGAGALAVEIWKGAARAGREAVMEFSVQHLSGAWRLCFRHAPGEPWTPVLGSPEFRTKKEASAALLQVLRAG